MKSKLLEQAIKSVLLSEASLGGADVEVRHDIGWLKNDSEVSNAFKDQCKECKKIYQWKSVIDEAPGPRRNKDLEKVCRAVFSEVLKLGGGEAIGLFLAFEDEIEDKTYTLYCYLDNPHSKIVSCQAHVNDRRSRAGIGRTFNNANEFVGEVKKTFFSFMPEEFYD